MKAFHQNFVSNLWKWPVPFTLEMQSCGFPNARYDPSTHKLTVCYELGADFAELYRSYGEASASNFRPPDLSRV
jgi:hypothetical protein